MKYIKLFEAYINSDGELSDFEPYSDSEIDDKGNFNFGGKYDSSMVLSDEEFDEMLEDMFESSRYEEISKIYDGLSEEHKKLTVQKFLELFLLDENQTNVNIVKDAIKWYPEEFKEFLKRNISYWWSFGNGVLEWNPILIGVIPSGYQELVYEYIKDFGEYELDMSKEMFHSFNQIIQMKISDLELFNFI